MNKNSHRGATQNYLCIDYSHQIFDFYSPKGYPDTVKEHCLKPYVNGLGFRAIERCTGVNYNTVINWVKALSEVLPDAPKSTEPPQIAQVAELEKIVGSKNKIWLWRAVNAHFARILAWVLGRQNAPIFWKLWLIIRRWRCFLYMTDGYPAYPCFIVELCSLEDDGDHLVSNTGMTRIKGANSRWRHYLARLHRKTFCYAKSITVLAASIKHLLHYLRFGEIPIHSHVIS